MTGLAATLQAFFTTRLIEQSGFSPHTITAYRDTWHLLVRFSADTTGKPPQALDFTDLTGDLVGAFLTHLEQDRGNSISTRNARLAAIHSVFAYAAYRHRTRRHHQQSAGDPVETPSTHRCDLPGTRGSHRASGGPRPHHHRRAPRPRTAANGRHHRHADLRTDRPEDHRHPPRTRGARPLPRQRPQRPRHPAGPGNRRRAARLHRRTSNNARLPVPHPDRHQNEPRRRRGPPEPAHRHRSRHLPQPRGQENHPTHPAAYLRNETSRGRIRRQPRRPVPRSRERRNHPNLHPRVHENQGSSTGPHHTHRNHTRALPTRRRHPPRLPPIPMITPTIGTATRPPPALLAPTSA